MLFWVKSSDFTQLLLMPRAGLPDIEIGGDENPVDFMDDVLQVIIWWLLGNPNLFYLLSGEQI